MKFPEYLHPFPPMCATFEPQPEHFRHRGYPLKSSIPSRFGRIHVNQPCVDDIQGVFGANVALTPIYHGPKQFYGSSWRIHEGLLNQTTSQAVHDIDSKFPK